MINIIAAVGQNGELGKDNHLLWHLKGDLKFFKEMTLNHTIIMGYNTFVSLGRVLPQRKHIVLSFHDRELPDDVILLKSIKEVLEYIGKQDVFVIGGASIYRQFIDYANKIYLTEIHDSQEADAFFPDFNKDQYTKKLLLQNEDNGISYDHVLYERK